MSDVFIMWLIGILLSIIILLLSWLGTTLFNKIDKLTEVIEELGTELRDKYHHLDRRMVIVEVSKDQERRHNVDPQFFKDSGV